MNRSVALSALAAAALASTAEAFGGAKINTPAADAVMEPPARRSKNGGAAAGQSFVDSSSANQHTHDDGDESAGDGVSENVEPELDAYGYPLGASSGLSSIHDGDANPCTRTDFHYVRSGKQVIGSQNKIIFYRATFKDADGADTMKKAEAHLDAKNMVKNLDVLKSFFEHTSHGRFTLTASNEHHVTPIHEFDADFLEFNDIGSGVMRAIPTHEQTQNILATLREEANNDGHNFCDFDVEYILPYPEVGSAPAWGYVGFGYGLSNHAFEANMLAHEIGHNFGLEHLGLFHATQGKDGTLFADVGYIEYGDPYDVMGLATMYPQNGIEYSVAQRALVLDWIPKANVYKIDDSQATIDEVVTLYPSSDVAAEAQGAFYGIHYDTDARFQMTYRAGDHPCALISNEGLCGKNQLCAWADDKCDAKSNTVTHSASVFIELNVKENQNTNDEVYKIPMGAGNLQVRLVDLGPNKPDWEATYEDETQCVDTETGEWNGYHVCTSTKCVSTESQCDGVVDCDGGIDEAGCGTSWAKSEFGNTNFILVDINQRYEENNAAKYISGLQPGQTLTLGAGVEITALGKTVCALSTGLENCMNVHIKQAAHDAPTLMDGAEERAPFPFTVSHTNRCYDEPGWNCRKIKDTNWDPDWCSALPEEGEETSFARPCEVTCGICEASDSLTIPEFTAPAIDEEKWTVVPTVEAKAGPADPPPTELGCKCLDVWNNEDSEGCKAVSPLKGCPFKPCDGDDAGAEYGYGSWCHTVDDAASACGMGGWDYCKPLVEPLTHPKVTLLHHDVECWSRDTKLGDFASVNQCADACGEDEDCRFFIFGNNDSEKNECFAEHTNTEFCYEGFSSGAFNYYKFNKPAPAPPTGTAAPATGTSAPATGTSAPATGTSAPATGTSAPATTGTSAPAGTAAPPSGTGAPR